MGSHRCFCLVCHTEVLLFAFSQTIKLFFLFSSLPLFLCEKFVCAKQRKSTQKAREKICKALNTNVDVVLKTWNIIPFAYVVGFTVEYCFGKHILSYSPVFFVSVRKCLLMSFSLQLIEKQTRWERNFYQIIIFVLSLMIAGVANGNCARHTLQYICWWFGCHYLRFFCIIFLAARADGVSERRVNFRTYDAFTVSDSMMLFTLDSSVYSFVAALIRRFQAFQPQTFVG